MSNSPHTLPRPIIIGTLILGILSALAFRSLMVLGYVEPSLVVPVWYFGVIGYTIFFMYRFYITIKRKRAIRDHQLIEKVNAGECLQGQDREVLLYLLTSICISREHINYYIIFALSIIAIIVDITLRFYL